MWVVGGVVRWWGGEMKRVGGGNRSSTPTSSLPPSETKRRDANTVERRIKRAARNVFLAKSWAIALILSYVDLGLDLTVGFGFLAEGKTWPGRVTLCLTAISLMTQAAMAFTLGQGLGATLLALLGAKPLVDTCVGGGG